MASRRGRGEGSIFRRLDGRWCGFVTLGYGPRGAVRKYVYGRSRREVADKLVRLLPRAGSGPLATLKQFSVSGWLAHWSAERIRERQLRFNTQRNYAHYLKLLAPLDRFRLAQLSPLHIRAVFAQFSDRRLSGSVRRSAFQFLKAALADAVRMDLISRNPADAVDTPRRITVRPAAAWDAPQAEQFLRVAKNHRLYPMFYLMLTTGLRPGEAMALRWEDLADGRLFVRHTLLPNGELGKPKTPASAAALFLDPGSELLLLDHRRNQELEASAARNWADHGLIFPSTVGTPLNYHNVARTWNYLVAKAGVPRITLHGLRHTYTSLAFRSGLNPKQVAARLRHTSPLLALKVYQHLSDSDLRDSALDLDTLLTPTARQAPAPPGSQRHDKEQKTPVKARSGTS